MKEEFNRGSTKNRVKDPRKALRERQRCVEKNHKEEGEGVAFFQSISGFEKRSKKIACREGGPWE